MFKSLTVKIVSTMVLLTVLCMSLLAAVAFFELKKSVEKQMENDGRTLVTTIRREISKYKINDLSEIQKIFKEVKNDSEGNIVYVSLSDIDSKILVSDSSVIDGGSKGNDGDVDAVSSATEQIDSKISVGDKKIAGSVILTSNGDRVYNVSAPFHYDGKLMGTINVGISINDMNKNISQTLFVILGIAIGIEILTILVGLFIAKTLTRPIGDTVSKLENFAKGDFTIKFSSKSRDEVHKLTESLNSSVAILKSTMGTVKSASQKLHQIALNVAESGEVASASGEEIAASIELVVNDIMEESANIESISKAVGDFGEKLDCVLAQTGNVLLSNDRIKKTSNEGHNKLENLIKSFDDVSSSFKSATDDINALNEDVSKIDEITEVINSVAEQTNLLALNAAIESARAGEAGKGFSVVADEIRKLAEQVMKSSKSINLIVKNITFRAKSVVEDTETITEKMSMQKESMQDSVESLGNIKNEVENIMVDMNEVSNALKNLFSDKEAIIKNVIKISDTSTQISSSSNQISATIQNQSANIQQLSGLARDLNDMADELKRNVDVFKV